MLFLKPESSTPSDKSIAVAADILRQEGVVGFPTETVYGLGARFDSVIAINKVFAAKGRPQDNPLIVHIATLHELSLIAHSISPLAERLMLSFWPGPLTIVLPKTNAVPLLATGGLSTVGVRMPAHPIALSLISATGVPLVAPSANRSGRPSATTAMHVRQDLGLSIDAIIDGGETEVGLESTVVSVRDQVVQILRPGAVTRGMLEEVSRVRVESPHLDPTSPPPSPGMKYTHYAPRAEVTIFMGQAVSEMPHYAQELVQQGFKVAVAAFADTVSHVVNGVVAMPLGERGRVDIAARRLYAYLREADNIGVTQILIEGIAAEGLGEALMNRLTKAATRVIGG